MTQTIILASSSRQRQTLFRSLGIPFTVVTADIDEKSIRDPQPQRQAENIARAKAEHVQRDHHGVIIAADTFAVHDNVILEKPATIGEAERMLRVLSGSTGTMFTGFCYLDADHDIKYSTVVKTEFTFRQLTDSEIATYVKTFPVTSWSASFSPAYPYGITQIAHLSGSLSGFTHGLPMEVLVPLLRRSGFDIRPIAD